MKVLLPQLSDDEDIVHFLKDYHSNRIGGQRNPAFVYAIDAQLTDLKESEDATVEADSQNG